MARKTGPAGPPETYDSVENAVRAELLEMNAWGRSPALCAAALKLARTLDLTDAARDSAALAHQLRGHIADLRAMPFNTTVETDLDRLKSRRAARMSAAGLSEVAQ